MSTPTCFANSPVKSPLHAEFLALVPLVEKQAHLSFRHRSPEEREEMTAEAVAACFQAFLRLKAAGKEPLNDFPWTMARFAVRHCQSDRHMGGHCTSTDVLSRKAQRKHGFRVQSLASSPQMASENFSRDRDGSRKPTVVEERLQQNRNSSIPDLVAMRLDFRRFLQTLTPRDRDLADYLALGHSAKAAAQQFQLCPGRVTQLRQRWHQEWLAFQGETPR